MEEVKYISPTESPDVFLSYSHDDAEIVEKIANGLEKAGFSCWIDTKNLRHDDEYHEEIFDGIAKCLVFIAFLSESYVSKEFCPLEFKVAREKSKSIISLPIDDVNENTNRKAAYMFVFRAGKTNRNYGKSLTDEDIDSVVEFLIDTYQLQKLKKYYLSGDENDIPSPKLPDAVMDTLRFSIEKQSALRANYALGEVNNILFPSVLDVRAQKLFRDETEEMTSLTRYLADRLENGERSNLFLYGEGGMGKTVAMLGTARFLLSKDIPAIYVPLSKIKKEEDITEYIDINVLGGNESYKKILYDFMSLDMAGSPSVVLLLDGVNELTADTDKAQQIVERIRSYFVDGYKGTDIIVTSRWDDPQVTGRIKDVVIPLEMQRFDTLRINRYLASVGIPCVSDPKILTVLSTPLLLTLYANVEQHIKKYGEIKGIELYQKPDTPAKILRNFFQTQLFRASEEPYFDRTSHFVLLEYLLPAIAFEMVKDKDTSGKVNADRIYELTDEIDEKEGRYLWFRKDILRKFTGGNTKVDTDLLLSTAVNSLHFLVPLPENEYEFIHQSFRDYFAAYHIVNEINAFTRDEDRAEEEESVLTFKTFSDDILSFAYDISDEGAAAPVRTDECIDYHGKTAPGDESVSAFENALNLFRGKEGESAQNAVYNLFTVMRLGRHGNLSFCDFSELDMRKCVLARSHFVDWYKDKIYPSLFDGAFIDTDAFLLDGHSASVNALCTDGDDLIFSGDDEGSIRICSISGHKCIKTLRISDEAIADIAYHAETKRIAAVTRMHLFEYSLETGESLITENPRRDHDYRYAGFDKKGSVTVSYTFEPLMPRYLTGETVEDFPANWSFDVPAGCAKWHPTDEKFVRSRMGQTFTATVRADDGKNWWMHPAFKDIMVQSAEGFDEEETLKVKNALAQAKEKKNLFCVQTTCKGAPNCVIVNLGRDIYMFDLSRKRILKKISFIKNIDSLYCSSRLINVHSEGKVLVFDMQLSLYTAMFSLKYFNDEFRTETVRCMNFNADGSRLVVCIGTLLLEFDFDTLTLIKKTVLPATVRGACYLRDKIIVAAGKKVFILSSNHVILQVFEESNQASVKAIVDDIEGDGCYIVTNGSVIKKLNRDLVLQRTRSIKLGSSFQWARHNITGKMYMLGRATSEYPFGRIYDFETGESCPMNESFRVIDVMVNEEDKKYYPVGNNVLAFNKRPPYNKIYFTNYSGVSIYGCSFKDIKGSISDEKGKEFIVSNGGLTDG